MEPPDQPVDRHLTYWPFDKDEPVLCVPTCFYPKKEFTPQV